MVEQKTNKTGAIIGTVLVIVLCGLPGLCVLCPLAIGIFLKQVPNLASSYGEPLSWPWGLLALCTSVIFILIAVLVPVLTLRKKKVQPSPLPPSEPLPPAS